MSEDGVHKAAVLMLALGQDEAAEVMKYLEPREVQKLGTAMSTMKAVSGQTLEAVLHEFMQKTQHNTEFGIDSDEYIRSVLTKALGDDKAAGLLDRILHNSDTSGIESLKWMDPDSVADLVANEHPQIIATIMVHLEPDQASAVLNKLTERVRNDVLLRIATLDSVQPTALHELNDVLTKLLSGNAMAKKSIRGGIKTAAEILNYIGSTQEAVIESIRTHDAELAQKVMDEMFVFEDILDVDDRGIQLVLREVQSESLIVALKGASEEMREKIFKNMSQRAAEMLREDLESKGPVKLSEVESEQKEILKVVRRLSDEGQIVLGGKGEDAYV